MMVMPTQTKMPLCVARRLMGDIVAQQENNQAEDGLSGEEEDK